MSRQVSLRLTLSLMVLWVIEKIYQICIIFIKNETKILGKHTHSTLITVKVWWHSNFTGQKYNCGQRFISCNLSTKHNLRMWAISFKIPWKKSIIVSLTKAIVWLLYIVCHHASISSLFGKTLLMLATTSPCVIFFSGTETLPLVHRLHIKLGKLLSVNIIYIYWQIFNLA